ncbi:MAG: winged helix-turn-helix transcriptional regulator [Thermoplasmata archaeon]|nr:winged helix-turn-helix transcriptional regulator [Thermoplasmata archaeon]
MLRSILEIMSRGGRSFSELALSLDISTRELRNRLQTLENMGYIEKMHGDEDGRACTLCSSASRCGGCPSNFDFPNSYGVTRKGMKLISERIGQ